MKKYYNISGCILAAVAILAAIIMCHSCRSGGNDTRPIITVSIQPQKWMLEKIVGNHYHVICLLSQGSNPETYEPSMNHLMNLEKSQAYFCIGNIGFEMAIVDKAKKNNPQIKIFNNSEGIELIHGSHQGIAHAMHSAHHHHEVDPHVWTSAENARIISQNMCNAVCSLDPKHASIYKKRLAALLQQINQLDSKIRQQLEPLSGQAFIVWHPSLSYFARDYGLKQIAMEYEGKEIPAKFLKQEIDSAKALNAKVFFYQKEFDSRQVETINEQIGAKMVTINPMNYNWDTELTEIANALASAENN
ncbi:MAG: metal ABC transporter solute-binding protein, Zn/Mn family [Muribaculaceae bacterium]